MSRAIRHTTGALTGIAGTAVFNEGVSWRQPEFTRAGRTILKFEPGEVEALACGGG